MGVKIRARTRLRVCVDVLGGGGGGASCRRSRLRLVKQKEQDFIPKTMATDGPRFRCLDGRSAHHVTTVLAHPTTPVHVRAVECGLHDPAPQRPTQHPPIQSKVGSVSRGRHRHPLLFPSPSPPLSPIPTHLPLSPLILSSPVALCWLPMCDPLPLRAPPSQDLRTGAPGLGAARGVRAVVPEHRERDWLPLGLGGPAARQ